MELPEQFTLRMKKMLGDDYKSFALSYEHPRPYGLRINSSKYMNKDEFPFTLSQIPWAENGFFAKRDEHPGRHPLHEAGAYYIQEPSAMCVVSLLAPKPGNIILDLCAAPGGKSTQIADKLCGEGLLVSNEIITSRSKILSRNIERLGITNAIVLNETPDTLAGNFQNYFDGIVVDAPCSGEGMFCKEEAAINEWSLDNIALCAKRQKHILEEADKMLKPNGVLVYSTCTFSPDENEEILLWFMRRHPEYHVEPYSPYFPGCTDKNNNTDNLCDGNPDFISEKFFPLSEYEKNAIKCAVRFWPHKIRGEGHFAVRLRKNTDNYIDNNLKNNINKITNFESKKRKNYGKINSNIKQNHFKTIPKNEFKVLIKMLSQILKNTDFITKHYENICIFGDEVYILPEDTPKLNNLKIRRAGTHLASKKKNRFEPAHAFAMSLHPNEVINYLELDKETATKFLHGDTLQCEPILDGWVLTGICGCSLGFGKAKNGILKNHYPKGLRLSF